MSIRYSSVCVAAIVLAAPFAPALAQDAAVVDPAASAAAPAVAEAVEVPALTPSAVRPPCPKHGAKGAGGGKKKCHHGGKHGGGKHGGGKHGGGKHRGRKHQQVLDRLERIEQRQVLIETMLRQLLERR